MSTRPTMRKSALPRTSEQGPHLYIGSRLAKLPRSTRTWDLYATMRGRTGRPKTPQTRIQTLINSINPRVRLNSLLAHVLRTKARLLGVFGAPLPSLIAHI